MVEHFDQSKAAMTIAEAVNMLQPIALAVTMMPLQSL